MQQDKSNIINFYTLNNNSVSIYFIIKFYLFINRLLNGRIKARRKQLNQIANLLEMANCETSYAPCNTAAQKPSLIINNSFKKIINLLYDYTFWIF